MKGTLDHLHREMDERFGRLPDTDTKFGFHLDVERSAKIWANFAAPLLMESSYIKKFWIEECCYQFGPT